MQNHDTDTATAPPMDDSATVFENAFNNSTAAPAQGGSYRQDPLTGELTLVERTEPATPRQAADVIPQPEKE